MGRFSSWSENPPSDLEKVEEAPELLREMRNRKPLAIREYGSASHQDIEAMMVAFLIRTEDDDETEAILSEMTSKDVSMDAQAKYVVDYGFKPSDFETKHLGLLFSLVANLFLKNRRRPSIDDILLVLPNMGFPNDEVELVREELHECMACLCARLVSVDVIVSRFRNRLLSKRIDDIYKAYKADAKEGDPDAAREQLRDAISREVSSAKETAIQAHDWLDNYDSSLGLLRDKKQSPHKYQGYKCGIDVIDRKTTGFHPGHLTVFVGAHGGFKTTTMLNVAYGLWYNKRNVLYVSLEMEHELVEIKLWCRGTRRVSFNRIYNGNMTEPEDFEILKKADSGEYDEDKVERIRNAIHSARASEGENNTDLDRINDFYEKFKNNENRFRIINIGQSEKIKLSQIENWLENNKKDFTPDVVVVDYLDLVASETPNPNRRDLELGDICKYMRSMGRKRGFSVITAAQFSRKAIERIRKHGLETPERAQVGTDDIGGSSQIGADADTVFMLFRMGDSGDGGNRVKVFTPKARHSCVDEEGAILQVDPDTCTIASMVDEIEDATYRARRATIGDAYEALDEVMNRPTESDSEFDQEVGVSPMDNYSRQPIFHADYKFEDDDIVVSEDDIEDF